MAGWVFCCWWEWVCPGCLLVIYLVGEIINDAHVPAPPPVTQGLGSV